MGLVKTRTLSCPLVPASHSHKWLAFFCTLLDGVVMAILLVVSTHRSLAISITPSTSLFCSLYAIVC